MIHPDMESFLRFTSDKRPSERYHFADADICACGQFADRIGERNWNTTDRHRTFWSAANTLASVEPHTFGGLSRRIALHIEGLRLLAEGAIPEGSRLHGYTPRRRGRVPASVDPLIEEEEIAF